MLKKYLKDKQNIQEAINNTLIDFYNQTWGSKEFLTENDLRCRLFSKLQSGLRLYKNLSIHSEIRWYGDKFIAGKSKKELKYRSDIVIIDHSDLRDKELPEFKLPSKGCGFSKYYCAIEIKLRRTNDKNSNSKYDTIIKTDIDKLNEIKERTTGGGIIDRSYYVIVFDKKMKRKKIIINNNKNAIWESWNI